jgi:hypothetical protein
MADAATLHRLNRKAAGSPSLSRPNRLPRKHQAAKSAALFSSLLVCLNRVLIEILMSPFSSFLRVKEIK